MSPPIFNPFFFYSDLANRNEGKHRNCNSQIRSRISQFFSQALFRKFLADSSIWSRAFDWMSLYWGESGDRDPGHITMKLWMIGLLKIQIYFFCFRKSNDLTTINKLKDLTSKEKEFSNLVLTEKKYFCRCCKF